MIGTYAAVAAICLSSPAIGQAAIALCGGRRWSWLAPAIGLALLCALCWWTVRLPGEGVVSAALALVLTVAAIGYLRGRVEGVGEALAIGWPVALAALLATALPFAAEGHFGILGTGFNPDMSQHLLATARLTEGVGSPLLHQGYPLGPHAIVAALNKGLGIGLVQGFDGLMIAVSVLASLTALAAFGRWEALPRIPAALLVGIPYMAASYFAQGAFKETMQALFVLAFVLVLREVATNTSWRALALRFAPAALLAVGSIYAYSFPGLIWPAGTAAIWLLVEWAWRRGPLSAGLGAAPLRALLLAVAVFVIGAAPELSRMIDFHGFETFDPSGPGLGNLFGQISPFEALGIWPSGDFRLAPGVGQVPAFGYYLGAAFAALLLLYGLALCWRRRESAVIAGLLAGALAYLAARVGGTPYTAAKAIEIAAPLAALAIVLPLARKPVWVLYLLGAGGCSLLALANAPVGPGAYSPALTGLRTTIGEAPTVVLASHRLLAEEQGRPYLVWELRGGRICVEEEAGAGGEGPAAGAKGAKPSRLSSVAQPPPGIRFVISGGAGERPPGQPPFSGLRLHRRTGPYVLWERRGPVPGKSDCPLIAVRQARQGPTR